MLFTNMTLRQHFNGFPERFQHTEKNAKNKFSSVSSGHFQRRNALTAASTAMPHTPHDVCHKKQWRNRCFFSRLLIRISVPRGVTMEKETCSSSPGKKSPKSPFARVDKCFSKVRIRVQRVA